MKRYKLNPILLAAAFVGGSAMLILAGCGTRHASKNAFPVQTGPGIQGIAISPAGVLAASLYDMREPAAPVVLNGRNGVVTTIDQSGAQIFGWNSAGRYLAYARLLPTTRGKAVNEALVLYDNVRHTSTPVATGTFPLTCSWVDNLSLALVTNSPSPTSYYHYSMRRLSIGPTGVRSEPIIEPAGYCVYAPIYDTASRRYLVAGIKGPRQGAPFVVRLYVVNGGRLATVPGSDRSASQMAFDKARGVAYVVLEDDKYAVMGIDTVNMRATTQTLRPLIATSMIPKNEGGGAPSLSPDGKKLVFSLWTRNVRGLYLYDIASRKLTMVAQGTDPLFSPDGKKLIYVIAGGPATGGFGPTVATCDLNGANSHTVYTAPDSFKS